MLTVYGTKGANSTLLKWFCLYYASSWFINSTFHVSITLPFLLIYAQRLNGQSKDDAGQSAKL